MTTPAEARATKATLADIAKACNGKEQPAFEAFARDQRYDMTEHPLHYIFMNPQTNAARMGWNAGLAYVRAELAALPPPEAKDGAAPSPETGWRPDWPPRASAFGLPEGHQRHGSTGQLWEIRNGQWFRLAASPAAPSPDLAALEELAGRLTRLARIYQENGFPASSIDSASALFEAATAIRSILKAQPNAGPSADGGKTNSKEPINDD